MTTGVVASESDSIVSMQSAPPTNYLLKCQKLPPQKTQNEMEYMCKDDINNTLSEINKNLVLRVKVYLRKL